MSKFIDESIDYAYRASELAKLDYHPAAQYIDCKKIDSEDCNKCGWTNR